MVVRPEVDSLPAYKPGIMPEEEMRRWGITELIRLNNNEEPWGPFPDAIAAMVGCMGSLNRYPDQGYRQLKTALAETYGVPAEQIIVGNGSSPLIRLLAQVVLREGDDVLFAWPPFPSYVLTTHVSAARVIRVPLNSGAMDLRAAVDQLGDRARLVIIANPHNPTGGLGPRDELEWYFENVPANVVTLLDEAYFEFVTEPGYPDTRHFLTAGKPLLGLRTFSKAYGLAGLRIGFGFATPEISLAMHKARDTFILSTLAAEAALASLKRQDLVQERVQAIVEGRGWLAARCDELGLSYLPSQANFMCVDVRRDSKTVAAEMLKRGLWVRSGDVHDLPTWLRVTIGLPEENERFVQALAEILSIVPELPRAA